MMAKHERSKEEKNWRPLERRSARSSNAFDVDGNFLMRKKKREFFPQEIKNIYIQSRRRFSVIWNATRVIKKLSE